MRRWAAILVIVCAGCSNAPIAGLLDVVKPARFRPGIDEPYREPVDPFGPAAPPQGGTLLPPQAIPQTPLPQPTPGGFQPPPSDPGGGGASPGPLKVPNT